MKHKLLMITIGLMCICLVPHQAGAQSLLKVLAQLGLNIEKLAQFRSNLKEAKRGYDLIFKGYGTVKDITEGNFNLHKTFLDGLLQVNPEVRKYHKIQEIVQMQLSLARRCSSALKLFRNQGKFSASEIEYLGSVYKNLGDESLRNLDELINVTTAGKMRMSDDERIKAIDRIHGEMTEKMTFLSSFNQRTTILAANMQASQEELKRLKSIQGITYQ